MGSSHGGGLQPGDPWWPSIIKELMARQFFLLIASPDAFASPWVKQEIEIAWKQHVEQGKRFITLLYQDCDLPEDIATLQYIDFRDRTPKAYSDAFHLLLDILGLPIGMDALKEQRAKSYLDPDPSSEPEAVVQQRIPQLKKMFEHQEWRKALQEANNLIHDMPGALPSDVYRMQGIAYLHLNDLSGAEEALNATFALTSDTKQQFSVLLEYIAIFHEKNQWDKIRDYTDKILDLLRDNSPLFTTALQILKQMAQGKKIHYSSLDGEAQPEPVRYLTYAEHKGPVFSVAWSPNGKFLASASTDQTVQVWECIKPHGHLITTCFHKKDVRCVAWSPISQYSREQYLATACDDGNIYLWQAFTGKLIHTFKGHKKGVRSVAWSRDGDMLASGSNDGTICLWDIAEKKLIHTFKGHSDWVNAVAWSPDGSTIASASSDGTVKIWPINAHECQLTYRGHHKKAVNALIWSPKGETIGSASDDKKVHLWKPQTGNLSFEYKYHSDPITGLAHSPHGRRLASVSKEATSVWYAATGDAILTNHSYHGWVRTVAWSPDGVMIAVAGDDTTVQVWSIGDEL